MDTRLRVRSWLGLWALCLLCTGAPAARADDAPPPKSTKSSNKPGGCVDVTTDARFASVGYDHIVTLKSGCKKSITCQVRTNVNPEASSVTLAPGESQSVVTWLGSPAREFSPNVICAPPS